MPRKKSPLGSVTIRLQMSTKTALERFCSAHEVPPEAVIDRALRDFLGRYQPSQGGANAKSKISQDLSGVLQRIASFSERSK